MDVSQGQGDGTSNRRMETGARKTRDEATNRERGEEDKRQEGDGIIWWWRWMCVVLVQARARPGGDGELHPSVAGRMTFGSRKL